MVISYIQWAWGACNHHRGIGMLVLLIFIETLYYDDGCHLKKYATNPSWSAVTPVATQLACLQIVVDRMHFKGHTDPWCHENCDPNKVKDLHKVRNTLN